MRRLLVLAALLACAAVARAVDTDVDGRADDADNCPAVANPAQVDADGDGVGNACDVCVHAADPAQEDTDADGVGDACDECPDTARDLTLRLVVGPGGCTVSERCPCEGPFDRTVTWPRRSRYLACVRREARRLWRVGLLDVFERAALVINARASECGVERGAPGDRDGDAVLDDGDESGLDGDARCTGGSAVACDDNCPRVRNPRQADLDRDGLGDACDGDLDGDGFGNAHDNCPRHPDRTRADADGDGVGDACDRCGDTPDAEEVDGRGCAEGQAPDDAPAS